MSARWTVHHAEVLETLRSMPDTSVAACLCDPPYGLGTKQPTREELIAYLNGEELDTGGDFMSKKWFVPSVAIWAELFRVLKPGGHVFAFGGSRTGDLISLGLRGAGFQIRDTCQWLYGSGMPKSQDASKAIDAANGDARPVIGEWSAPGRGSRSAEQRFGLTNDSGTITAPGSEASAEYDGFGSALKPFYEPVILARRPLEGTLAENIAKWGTGPLAIDACRIEYQSADDKAAQRLCLDQNANRTAYGNFTNGPASLGPFLEKQDLGRWPANVLMDEEVAAELDAQAGDHPGMSGGGKHAPDYAGGMFGGIDSTHTARNDNGGPSRFLYVAKASREERDLGCDALPMKAPLDLVGRDPESPGAQSGRAGAGRTSGGRNSHIAVKPIALCRYLARLIKPPRGGTIAVPFSGSGSEMIGCLLEGWDSVVGIEREAEYVAIARARLGLAASNPRAFEPFANRKPERVAGEQVSLFGIKT